jgi:RNA polymerase sigma-70 factor (ECF subfamily)
MRSPTSQTTSEGALLDAARAGDGDAFRRLVEPYRGVLHAHCYRLLASSHDADDALQETLLRAWRALDRFVARGSLRAWLYTIATNVSLRLIERRPRRVLPIEYGPPAEEQVPLLESVWLGPYSGDPHLLDDEAAPEARYEQLETLELAFIAALQHLSPNQRAALILRDGLGFSAEEVARSLGTTVGSVTSALQRARRTVDERVPEPTQQRTLRALGDERLRRLVEDYIAALADGDVSRVLALLTEEATWSMLAAEGDTAHGPRTWFRGRQDIARFLGNGPLSGQWSWRHLAAEANGQLAVAGYLKDARDGKHRLRVLDVLTLDGARIAGVTAFLDPRPLSRLSLPAEI